MFWQMKAWHPAFTLFLLLLLFLSASAVVPVPLDGTGPLQGIRAWFRGCVECYQKRFAKVKEKN